MARTPGLLSVSQAESLNASRGDWERDPTLPRSSNVYRNIHQHGVRISYRTYIELYRGRQYGAFTQRNFRTWDQAFRFVRRLPPRARVYVLAFGTNVVYPGVPNDQWWTVMENTERGAIKNVNVAQIHAQNLISKIGTAERNPIAVRYHT